MSTKLAQIFGDLSDKAASEIERLETRLGFPSEDVRLLADSHQKIRQKLAELNLDPDDTTPKELYQTLRSRYQHDCDEFERSLSPEDLTTNEKVRGSLAVAQLLLKDQSVWALKRRSAKVLLKNLPPVRTKKALGFRTFASMLKRTDASLILLTACHIESASWQIRFQRALAKTTSSDWEVREIKVMLLPEKMKLEPKIMANKAAGAVAINYHDQPLLIMLFQLLQAASNLTGRDTTKKLADFSPSLKWWLDNSHLVAWLDGEPVSLNLLDVSTAHQVGSFEQRSFEHAANHLWRKLVQRYKNLAQDVTSVHDVAIDLSGSKKLAPELVAIEDINE